MSRRRRATFTALLASSAFAALPVVAGASHSSVAHFPGDGATEVRSQTGVTVYYVDPGADADGNDDRPIMLRYPNGRTEQIDTFGRHADVSWSPLGDRLVITNWIGSNVADCTVIRPSNSGARKQSFTSLITREHIRSVSRDILDVDHVYVSCGRWVAPGRVQVEVSGHGCNQASCTSRSFDHFLIYDFRSGRFSVTGRRTASPLAD
jgi:hypothetical protein